MKRFLLIFSMAALVLMSAMPMVSAANTVTFKVLKVYVNDGKVVVQGKFWNYGDEAAVVKVEKLQVSYKTPSNQLVSGPEEFKDLDISLEANGVVPYTFTCNDLQALTIGKWSVNTHTDSN